MKKYENFRKALENLKDVNKYNEPYDKVVLAGLVAFYETCFEQSWKAMKEVLDNQGFPEAKTGSPKQILKTAYVAGLIKDEQIWLEALQARNDVTHSYSEKIALGIVQGVKDKYLQMFIDLDKSIQECV